MYQMKKLPGLKDRYSGFELCQALGGLHLLLRLEPARKGPSPAWHQVRYFFEACSDILGYAQDEVVFPGLGESFAGWDQRAHAVVILCRMVFGDSSYVPGGSADIEDFAEEDDHQEDEWAICDDYEYDFLKSVFLPLYWLLHQAGHCVRLAQPSPEQDAMDGQCVLVRQSPAEKKSKPTLHVV